jgi:hypothetical protein
LRNPGGYAVWSGGDGRDVEADSVTCCHCNNVTLLTGGKHTPVGFCRRCMKACCEACEVTCTPFEKELEKMEARGRSLRSMGF